MASFNVSILFETPPGFELIHTPFADIGNSFEHIHFQMLRREIYFNKTF
jgi:hypothetical protein